jgi:hypothetical protein
MVTMITPVTFLAQEIQVEAFGVSLDCGDNVRPPVGPPEITATKLSVEASAVSRPAKLSSAPLPDFVGTDESTACRFAATRSTSTATALALRVLSHVGIFFFIKRPTHFR